MIALRGGQGGGVVEVGAEGGGVHEVEDAAAEGLAGGGEVVEHHLLHAALAGGRRDEVVDEHVVCLADAVQPAGPLLEAHQAPRDVPVDHDVGALEVDALAAGVSRDQHLVRPGQELLLQLVAALRRHSPSSTSVEYPWAVNTSASQRAVSVNSVNTRACPPSGPG